MVCHSRSSPLGSNHDVLSCFLHNLTHMLGSCLTETPHVPSALCHLHAFVTVASLALLCGKVLETEDGSWHRVAPSQLGTWGADFLLVPPMSVILPFPAGSLLPTPG